VLSSEVAATVVKVSTAVHTSSSSNSSGMTSTDVSNRQALQTTVNSIASLSYDVAHSTIHAAHIQKTRSSYMKSIHRQQTDMDLDVAIAIIYLLIDMSRGSS
jgi:hypothetical protein